MAFDEVKINTGIEHNCLVVSFVDLGNTSSGGVWAAVNPRVCIEVTKNEQSIEEHDSISCYTHAGVYGSWNFHQLELQCSTHNYVGSLHAFIITSIRPW